MTGQLAKAAGGQPVAKSKGKPTTIHGMLETYKGELSRALPKHMTADRLARVALTECRKTPALLKCSPESLFGAVVQAAQLGLEPGGALGHCYLIPFGQNVQFIVGYRGMIDLARRSGQIQSLNAVAVYEGDEFECTLGLNPDIKHRPNWENSNREDPKKLLFVYAVAKLKDGGVQFEVMSRKEVDAIRARSKSANNGPWVTDYVAMSLKTVIRRLFKYLPVSIEMQQAVAIDEQTEAGVTHDHWNNSVIDIQADDVSFGVAIYESGNESVTDKKAKTFAEVAEAIKKNPGHALDYVDQSEIGHLPPDQQQELIKMANSAFDEANE